MNTDTKRHIDAARQVLVGVVPNPTAQIEQITNALIYKFMDDMDQASIKVGGDPAFFVGELEKYSWTKLMSSRMGNQERMNLYAEALLQFSQAKQLPELFRGIFRSAFLPYRSPETLGLFLKEIDYFDYSHPEELGNAYEYLLSIMSSQGDAGQFRTPRHIIDFIVDVVNPTKDDKVLDPACGTGGFLVSSYKHILEQHDGKNDPNKNEKPLTPDDRKKLMANFEGYDIDPTMVRIAQVNMYLHQFKNPQIFQYDSLSSDERWNDKFDVILANPPFMSPRGGIRPHSKFSIPSSRSEVLFVDYIMNHLRPRGRAGIIVPEGIIFQSGTAHKQLRKNLVEDGLYAVVSLPSGVFAPYSGVKTSILLFDNELAKKNKELLFIDIKDTGVSLGATQRPIEKNDLIPARNIIKKFCEGEKIESSLLAFTTAKSEIIARDFNLSQSKYKKKVTLNTEKPFVMLLSVCKIEKGKSSSTKTKEGIYPLYLTAESYKTADHFDFDGEGVAVPLISATGHGKAAIKRIHYIKGKFALANLLAFLTPNNTQELNPKYLFYVLNSAKEDIACLMKGAANVSMKTSDLEGFQIPKPPIEIQKQIVAELDSYASIIAGAKQIVKNWRPKIYIDPVWENVNLSEVASFNMGGTPSQSEINVTNANIPWVKGADLVKGYIFSTDNFITTEGMNNSRARYYDVDTVLVGRTGQGKTRGTVAILKVKSTTNETMIGIFPDKNKLDPDYLFYYLGMRYTELRKIGGENERGGLTQRDLGELIMVLPPLNIQKSIVREIEAERVLVDSAKKLIEIYEHKTKEKIAELWKS